MYNDTTMTGNSSASARENGAYACSPEVLQHQKNPCPLPELTAQNDKEQIHEELMRQVKKNLNAEHDSPIEVTTPTERRPFGVRVLNAVNNTSNSAQLDYGRRKSASVSQEDVYVGEDQASTPSLSASKSTRFESNGEVGTISIPRSPPQLYLELRDNAELVNKPKIEESDAELINRGFHQLNGSVNEVDAEIARAAYRGRGLPDLGRKPNLPSAPSEVTDVTDLGNHLYELKVQGQVVPPISYSDPREPLPDRLIDALQNPGYQEKKGFFPRDMLASLVDEECVVEELREVLKVLDDNAIRDCARKICGVGTSMNKGETQPLYKKIFVTLVLCEQTSSILKFLAEMVTDDDLPLVKVGRPGKSSGIFDLARRPKPNMPVIPLTCFRGWSIIPIRSFEEWQWTTISPFFARSKGRKNVKHFILQDQAVLPFISDSRRDSIPQEILEFEGGYGQVFKVGIHPEHHDFHVPRTKNRSFAIKCLLSRNKDDFDHEVEMLKKFSGDSHPHLVSLLATYEQFQRFYLVFHWAEADLKDYWKDRNPRPLADYKTILWVAQQCEGIANGLQKIHHYESSSSKDQSKTMLKVRPLSSHNLAPPGHHAPTNSMDQLFGRHGDIKPENVLFFSDPDVYGPIGTLKLTDFGLAEFSSIHSRSYKPKSKVAISLSYRAPECDLQDGVIGRSYDIWTLGCLYLEFITWLLGGWKLVEQFTEKRITTDAFCYDIPTDTFFEIVKCGSTGPPGAMIKPAVTDFILDLHAHPKCTEYCHQFLHLIQYEMMIVKPNDPNVRGRISCEQVDQALSKMLRNCIEDTNYASKPAPWSRSRMERITTIQSAVEADTREPGVEALLRKDLRIHNGPTDRIFIPTYRRGPLCHPMHLV